MAEEYTCIECENLYDDIDGDIEKRMCNKCINKIYTEKIMSKVDKLINILTGKERKVTNG